MGERVILSLLPPLLLKENGVEMDQDTAMARLSSMVAAEDDPQLDSDKLMELLDMFAVADEFGNIPKNVATANVYTGSTTYVSGDVVRTSSLRFWRCVVGGTSSGITFPANTGILSEIPYFVADGSTLVWQDIGSLWIPTWDLYKAAAEGWRWKAAQLINKFDFASDNQKFDRSQRHAHCLMMAAEYKKKTGGTFRVSPLADYANVSSLYFLPVSS